MERLTKEELESIRKRAEAATPGPWIVSPEQCGPEGQGVYTTESFGKVCEVGDPYPRGDNHPQGNMTFIAQAREDIPKLLAEIDRLNKEVAEFKSAATVLLRQIDLALGTAIPRGSFFHGREVLTEALLNANKEA